MIFLFRLPKLYHPWMGLDFGSICMHPSPGGPENVERILAFFRQILRTFRGPDEPLANQHPDLRLV